MDLPGINSVPRPHHRDKAPAAFCQILQKPDLWSQAIDGVDHIICLSGQFSPVFRIQKHLMAYNMRLIVDRQYALFHQLGFWFTDAVPNCQQLPVQIAGTHCVKIYQNEMSDSSSGKGFNRVRAYSAQAGDAYAALFQMLQRFAADQEFCAGKIRHKPHPVKSL